MSTETDQAAARKAHDLYPFDGSDPNTILALHAAFRAGAEFATEHTPSVVPEAAVEAAKEALLRECGIADADMRKWVRVPVRNLRTALTAAPSATREATEDEVTEVVTEALTDAYRAERGMSRHTGLTAYDESVIRDQAAHVVNLADARFTITPKEDR